jgi:hypothetical protein
VGRGGARDGGVESGRGVRRTSPWGSARGELAWEAEEEGGGVREGRWGAGEVGRGMVGPGRPALFRCCAWIFVKDV